MIKYKHGDNNTFIMIDTDSGISRTFHDGKPGTFGAAMYLDMMKWESKGNEIEPLYTEQELIEKEQEEAEQALESQKKICTNLLNLSEIHVSNDPPYPDDVQLWKDWRAQIRVILKGDTIESIPDKPF